MKKINLREEAKKELTEGLDLKFDTSKLESNKKVSPRAVKRNFKIGLLCFGIAATLAIVAVPVAFIYRLMSDTYMDVTRNYKMSSPKYTSQNKNTFIGLNSIQYPESDPSKKEIKVFSETEKESYLSFASQIYSAMDMKSIENCMISPITLYGFFISSYGMISDPEVMNKYDSLLKLTNNDRVDFYKKMFENNFNLYQDGVVELHNGVFVDGKGPEINPDYIDYLSSIYAEAYSLYFNKNDDVKKMIDWVNNAIGEKDYLKKDDLSITANTCAFLFSTLNFEMKWYQAFEKTDSYTSTFHTRTKDIETKFMKHFAVSDYMYDYPNYVVVSDKYKNNYSVTYIVSKTDDFNTFDLVNGNNVFKYDENYRIEPEFVDLHVPCFEKEAMFNFYKLMSNLNLADIFNASKGTFNNLYKVQKSGSNTPDVYLEQLKQKNKVVFDEEGTIVKSLTIGAFGAKSAQPVEGKLIKLNRPFIYIIRDQNGMPLYVGHMENPANEQESI